MASGARLTAAVLCEAQVSQERVQSGFVSLRQSLSGRLVCYPGVSLAKNGWIVPSPNLVGGLVGSLVLLVAEDGSVDSDGPQHRVAAVLDSSGVTMAHKTMSLGECAVGSDVFVVFGLHVAEYVGPDVEARPCADLGDVSTPRTPDPFEP